MKNKIIRRLTRNLILTFFISCILTTITILIFYNKQMGSLEGNTGISLFIIGGFLLSFVMTVLSTTVYLNIYDTIRNDNIRCLLTFFLLPIFVLMTIFFTNGNFEMWTLYLVLCVPFIATQIFFYINFKKTLTDFDE